MSKYEEIYAVVKRIPRGRVASYGRVARVVGCGAREVGYAMAAAPDGWAIPWWRVINRRGEISARKGGDGEARQRRRLLDEGVVFDARGRVDFARFGWGESTMDLWDAGAVEESAPSAESAPAPSPESLEPATESAPSPPPPSSPPQSFKRGPRG